MVKLSNSPSEFTVLALEARKSFSLRVELHDRQGNLMSWEGLECSLTIGKTDPLEVLVESVADEGVFRLQASDLDLKPGNYSFTVVLRWSGYSFVIVKGEVWLLQNVESASTEATYDSSTSSETLAVRLDGAAVIYVGLRNTPTTLGVDRFPGLLADWLAANPLDVDPAGTAAAAVQAHEGAADPHPQYVTEAELPVPPDLSGYATTTALTAGLAGKADAGHTHAEYLTEADLPTGPDTSGLAPKSDVLGVIHHTSASDPRPAGYGAVYWTGPTEPINAIAGDIWRQP